MENGIQVFENSGLGSVRVVMQNGEPWFVAKDVCCVLGIEWKGSATMGPLDDDEKGVDSIDTPGGAQEMSIVSDAGLYSLILRSRKPEAKALPYQMWVAGDVCECLELDLASGARGLDDDEKGLHTMQTPGGAQALGYQWNGAARIAHIPEEWRGVTSVVTPFGEQTMLTISEQGLYFFLGRSDKPKAIPDFQNPALAARAWAEQYERRQIAEALRDLREDADKLRHQARGVRGTVPRRHSLITSSRRMEGS